MGIRVRFFNGAKTKSAWDPASPDFIDDWKPEERTVECDDLTLVYSQHLRLFGVVGEDGQREEVVELWTDDDLFAFDGVFYGDLSITADSKEN